MTGHRNTTPFVAFGTKEDRQPPLYVAPGEQTARYQVAPCATLACK